MQRKNKTKAYIRTNSGRLAWCGYIYPMTVCGSRHYNSSFRLASEVGCLATDSNHKVAGGRDQAVIEVPDGYELLQLTKPQVSSLIEQLPDDGQQWWTSDTVHGVWKCREHQGVVLINSTTSHVEACESWTSRGLYGLFVFVGAVNVAPAAWIDRRRPFPTPLVERICWLVEWICWVTPKSLLLQALGGYLNHLSSNMGLLDRIDNLTKQKVRIVDQHNFLDWYSKELYKE